MSPDCCERGLGTRVERSTGLVEHDAGGRYESSWQRQGWIQHGFRIKKEDVGR
jgi:hypothetical protein